jgi:hypothetical protein
MRTQQAQQPLRSAEDSPDTQGSGQNAVVFPPQRSFIEAAAAQRSASTLLFVWYIVSRRLSSWWLFDVS